MKKYYLLIPIFMIIGCASIGKWFDAQMSCASDSECLDKVKSASNVGQAVSAPFGTLISALAGSVVTFGALGIYGLKKKGQR